MPTFTTERLTGRSLISDELFDRLVTQIVRDEKIDRLCASRIMDQALGFLKACAGNTGAPLAPSPLVDVGWHTFVLHTRDYATFCDRTLGRFVHHVPATEPWPDNGTRRRTTEAIRAAGYAVDADLWPTAENSHTCSPCHNGCSDDPPPNPE